MTVNVFIHQLQAVVMAIFFEFNMIINIFRGPHCNTSQKSQRTGKTGLRLPERTPLTNARMSVDIDISSKLSIRYFTLTSDRYIDKDIDKH